MRVIVSEEMGSSDNVRLMRVEPTPTTDGRRARRERGRVAAATAMIDLVLEGYSPPSAEQIADRAGISSASLFRYFETLDDLRDHGSQIYFDRYSDLMEIPNIGEGTLEQRVKAIVAARIKLYETTAPMARLLRHRATDFSSANEMLRNVRSTFADQFSQHFDAELASLSKATRNDVSAMGAILTSFESWEQLASHFARTDRQVIRAWTRSLTTLLS